MKKATLFFVLIFITLYSSGQDSIVKQWQKVFGGYQYDVPNNGCATMDGGCIILSRTNSYEIVGHHGGDDIWIFKLDIHGNILWEKCYGTAANEYGHYIQPVSIGGYIIVGCSDFNDPGSAPDGYIIRISDTGEELWTKYLNIANGSCLNVIKETDDGGFICGGSITTSFEPNETLLLKIDSIGNSEWHRHLNENNYGFCMDIVKNEDGYLFLSQGNTVLTGQYIVYKTTLNGEVIWMREYGNEDHQQAARLLPQTNGNFLLIGYTTSLPSTDGLVISINETGDIVWQKNYGSYGNDRLYGGEIINNEIILTGATDYFPDGIIHYGGDDFWVFRINNSGEILRETSYGGAGNEGEPFPIVLINNDIVIAGWTYSFKTNKQSQFEYSDCLVIKECKKSDLEVTCTNPLYCETTQLYATDGFFSYNWNTGDTSNTIEVAAGGQYQCTAVNHYGCVSNSSLIIPDPIMPDNNPQICMVTLDNTSKKNIIIPLIETNPLLDSLFFYRLSNSTSTYSLIAKMEYVNAGSLIDYESFPDQQSYEYAVTVSDSYCHKESDFSIPHKSILLQANTGINSEVNLFWNAYQGFEYPNFEVYRSHNGSEYYHIADIPNNVYTYTDLFPPSGQLSYQIRITKEIPCEISRSINKVSSNFVQTSSLGIPENINEKITVYPNPVFDKLYLDNLGSRTNEFEEFYYNIFDLKGNLMLSGKANLSIDVSELPKGNYFISVEGLLNKKFTKN
jgi:hypothetical protein